MKLIPVIMMLMAVITFVVKRWEGFSLKREKRQYLDSLEGEALEEAESSPADLLRNEDWKTRLSAIQQISDMEVLIEALRDNDTDVRAAAREKLVAQGKSIVPMLIPLLQSNNTNTREQTAIAMGELGDSSAVPHLIAALDDVSLWVRLPIVKALGQLGGKPATDALTTKALRDPHPDMQQAAREALKQIEARSTKRPKKKR